MSAVTSSALPTITMEHKDILEWWRNLDRMQISPEREAWNAEVRKSILNTLSPLNLTLVAMLLTLVYFRFFRASSSSTTLSKDQPIVFSTFTPRTLLRFNGKPNNMNPDGKVYLAVKGKVHDVTSGRNFYGPGGPYENFAGRDATRGLACQSFEDDMLTKDLDGELDDCADLTDDQKENLQSWVDRFNEKYLVVGQLKPWTTTKQYGF